MNSIWQNCIVPYRYRLEQYLEEIYDKAVQDTAGNMEKLVGEDKIIETDEHSSRNIKTMLAMFTSHNGCLEFVTRQSSAF